MSSFPDLIIENARVLTQHPGQPHAEAVALRGERIVFVGSNTQARALRGPGTRSVDAQGCTLLPGFIDSHFHLLWGSRWLDTVPLQPLRRVDDLRAALQAFAADHPDELWVIGRGMIYGLVASRQDLDALLPDRPVYLGAYDGHTAWVNTRALQLAGILEAGEPAGPNGIIVRDAAGLATGELREHDAMRLVLDCVPPPDAARRLARLQLAMQQIVRAGVTSVHNMNGDLQELQTYARLEASAEMLLRVYVPYQVEPGTTEAMLDEAAEMKHLQGKYARGGAAKFYMDGVWESGTALRLEPYDGLPQETGPELYSLEHFTRMAAACDRLGLQIAVHACGDGAVRRTLDGYQAVQQINGRRDSRHRVEHIEVCHPADLPRFRQLGVIASMQPLHAPLSADGGDLWTERAGRQRWPFAFAWRALKQAGATLALGSDWNVVSFDPILGLAAALTRRPWAPGDPPQALALDDALAGYTRDAAYTEFMETEKGRLQPGMLADLVLMDADLERTPPEALADLERMESKVKPALTVVGGRVVFEA